MQDFISRAPMAFSITTNQIELAPGTELLKAADYARLCKAQSMINHAKAQSQEAIAGSDAVLESARQEGLERGRQEGRVEVLDSLTQMQQSMDTWVQDTESSLLELVCNCVEDVVQKSDKLEIVKHSIQEGLGNLRQAAQIEVKVAPEQFEEVNEWLTTFTKEKQLSNAIRLLTDAGLEKGDCVVDTPLGMMDLSIKNRLSRIKANLLGRT